MIFCDSRARIGSLKHLKNPGYTKEILILPQAKGISLQWQNLFLKFFFQIFNTKC